MRTLACSIVLMTALSSCDALERNQRRDVSESDAVVAVYREDWGIGASAPPALIVASWSDGYIVWSKDRVRGGAPYFSHRIAPQRFKDLLADFDRDGLLKKEGDAEVSLGQIDPHSEFTTIMVRSGAKRIAMSSGHELAEPGGTVVEIDGGLLLLEGRKRLDVLKDESAEYLFFRMVWEETRRKIDELVPEGGDPCRGSLVMRRGIAIWQEE